MCVCAARPVQREPVPDNYSSVDLEHKLIYRFVRTLFSAAQLTAECAIVTLVSASTHLTTRIYDIGQVIHSFNSLNQWFSKWGLQIKVRKKTFKFFFLFCFVFQLIL